MRIALAKILYRCDLENMFLDSKKAGHMHDKRKRKQIADAAKLVAQGSGEDSSGWRVRRLAKNGGGSALSNVFVWLLEGRVTRHTDPIPLCICPTGKEKAEKVCYNQILKDAMGSHLMTNYSGSSQVCSAPRDALNMSSLVGCLETPLTKRRRLTTSHPDALDTPDVEVHPPRLSTRVCFRIVFICSRRTVPVAVGAGGSVKKSSIAISVHPEPDGLGDSENVIVNQANVGVTALSSHFILDGFSDVQRAESEVAVYKKV